MDSIRSKCTTCQPGGSGRLSKAIRLWTGFGIKTSLARDCAIKLVDVKLLKWFLSSQADCALFMWAQILSHTPPPDLSLAAPPLLLLLLLSYFPSLPPSHTHTRTNTTNGVHKAVVYPQTYCQWPRKLARVTNSSSYSFKVEWLHQSWLLRSPSHKN